MDLSVDARIPFPPDVVFAACRDDIVQLLPYLPAVRTIQITSRKESGPIVDLVVDWCAGGDVFAPIRALIGPSAFSWTDYATWNADALSVDWRTKTRVFGEAMRCGARDVFLQDGSSGTILRVRGVLEVDAKEIPGIPSVFASKMGRSFETFLVGRLQVSIEDTAKALTRYLTERHCAAS